MAGRGLGWCAVHDNRALVEERIDRELFQRVLPFVHRAAVPLRVTAGPSPQDQAPWTIGARWGAPWTTTWFRFTGTVP